MGLMTGGFAMKASALSDEEILKIFGRKTYSGLKQIIMDEAISRTFEGIGIARVKDLTLVVGSDLAYSFSFENQTLSQVDKSMEDLSRKFEILCFLINSIADTYAWSIFRNGKRIRVKCVAEMKIIYEWGAETEYDKELETTDDGMVELIENFTRLSFSEIVSENNLVNAYFY
jgi:hypothetical protein